MANKHSSIILTHTLLTILLLQLIRTVDSSSWNPSYSNRAENALARFNSRFSKAIAEELDNSTVAMDNNTVEENMVPSSTTSDDVTYYPSRKEKPSGKVEEENTRTPGGAAGTSVKPTKYHYYPHNQHIYLLPECAVQQVCNAVYVRLNYTQPLCACPSRYREPCSASINSDDFHTTELTTDPQGKVLTLVKTCEPVLDMRLCRSPRDWSLLALQNIRTGKSHYLVICRCPDSSILEGPMSHDQPTYASVPGIRVYGMMCVNRAASVVSTTASVYHTSSTTYRTPTPSKRKSRPLRLSRSVRVSRQDMPLGENCEYKVNCGTTYRTPTPSKRKSRPLRLSRSVRVSRRKYRLDLKAFKQLKML
ncbi:uncharacterized protein LOC103513157 [Diaphorina citri]|uniref:Uncharacterized protein LOC103513157 n=1 Tax=Diaphorina citri TaxID=121845 RepID=A0A3Q0J1A8_DIACI|nr:uncharacterized protein LOC103513157 [Diaphorina citri]